MSLLYRGTNSVSIIITAKITGKVIVYTAVQTVSIFITTTIIHNVIVYTAVQLRLNNRNRDNHS